MLLIFIIFRLIFASRFFATPLSAAFRTLLRRYYDYLRHYAFEMLPPFVTLDYARYGARDRAAKERPAAYAADYFDTPRQRRQLAVRRHTCHAAALDSLPDDICSRHAASLRRLPSPLPPAYFQMPSLLPR